MWVLKSYFLENFILNLFQGILLLKRQYIYIFLKSDHILEY